MVFLSFFSCYLAMWPKLARKWTYQHNSDMKEMATHTWVIYKKKQGFGVRELKSYKKFRHQRVREGGVPRVVPCQLERGGPLEGPVTKGRKEVAELSWWEKVTQISNALQILFGLEQNAWYWNKKLILSGCPRMDWTR